jgi:hypothetical protein
VVSGVIDATDHKTADFKVKFSGKLESTCKTALKLIPGAQMELFDEKTRGRKFHYTVSLKVTSCWKS